MTCCEFFLTSQVQSIVALRKDFGWRVTATWMIRAVPSQRCSGTGTHRYRWWISDGVLCRRVVEQLSGRGTQVVALVRDVAKARQTLPVVNVDVVQGDLYQFASLPGALDNVDAVICAAGFNDMLDPLGPFKVDYTVRVSPLFTTSWLLLRALCRMRMCYEMRTGGMTADRRCGLQGTVNLVEACKQAGIGRLVLVTSLGTDDGLFSPLGPILFWKKRAEEHLQRSGLTYTIVRPGGLVSDAQRDPAQRGMLPAALAQVFGQARARGEGNLVTGGAGTFGLPPKKSGSVLRSKVRVPEVSRSSMCSIVHRAPPLHRVHHSHIAVTCAMRARAFCMRCRHCPMHSDWLAGGGVLHRGAQLDSSRRLGGGVDCGHICACAVVEAALLRFAV